MEDQDTRKEIERVAYELYLKSGKEEGKDVLNWLMAERMVKARRAADLDEQVKKQGGREDAPEPVGAADERKVAAG